MLRVLVSTSTLPLSLDDVRPRFVLDLAEGLSRECDVTLLAPAAPDTPRRSRWGNVEIVRFTYFRPRRFQRLAYGSGIRDNLKAHPVARFQTLPFLLAQTAALRRLVRERQIEAVNSHWLIPQGLTSAIARGKRRPRFRHLLSVHAGDVYMLEKLPMGHAIARFILDRTDAVFADGSHVSTSLDKLAGRDVGATLQPMGAHLSVFRDGPAELPECLSFTEGFLVFCGRFSEKKGVIYLLRALPRVLQAHPGLGLVLVGYGFLEQKLREEVARSGLSAKVHFAGAMSHEGMARYLRAARLAVVPSIVDSNGETEGMPTVVIEAMAAGKPVVGCAVDGIPDVIRHGENGWLCREKDPDDLAEKILDALDREACPTIQASVRSTAESFDWPRVADRYLASLRKMVAV